MATAAVRTAAASDVDEIVRLQAATWRTAYTALLPPSALDQIDSPAARQAWTAAVHDSNGHVLIATEGGWTVGFCAVALSPDAPGWAEVSTLLVEPRWGRRGHGGRLLAAAAAAVHGSGAAAAGGGTVQSGGAVPSGGAVNGLVWVPEADTASRRFYARAGWGPDGTVRVLDTGDGELREVRITGPLDLTVR